MKTIQEQAATVLQEIDAALALADKATAGPWEHYHEEMPPSMLCTLSFETVRVKGGNNLLRQNKASDAAFIAAARTVCPTALRCLKTAIEGLLRIAESETSADPYEACNHPSDANETLTTLINQWNSK